MNRLQYIPFFLLFFLVGKGIISTVPHKDKGLFLKWQPVTFSHDSLPLWILNSENPERFTKALLHCWCASLQLQSVCTSAQLSGPSKCFLCPLELTWFSELCKSSLEFAAWPPQSDEDYIYLKISIILCHLRYIVG